MDRQTLYRVERQGDVKSPSFYVNAMNEAAAIEAVLKVLYEKWCDEPTDANAPSSPQMPSLVLVAYAEWSL
jgi:hypothetical protein